MRDGIRGLLGREDVDALVYDGDDGDDARGGAVDGRDVGGEDAPLLAAADYGRGDLHRQLALERTHLEAGGADGAYALARGLGVGAAYDGDRDVHVWRPLCRGGGKDELGGGVGEREGLAVDHGVAHDGEEGGAGERGLDDDAGALAGAVDRLVGRDGDR